MAEQLSSEAWMRYALERIQSLVDRPREDMTEDQFSIFTFAQNALAGGDATMRAIARGPGVLLCRVCLAEWNASFPADHVHDCPQGAVTEAPPPE